MNLALRGVMDADGHIVVWPTLLMDHKQAFRVLPHLADYRVRFRQWGEGGPPDIDPGCTPEDAQTVRCFLANLETILP